MSPVFSAAEVSKHLHRIGTSPPDLHLVTDDDRETRTQRLLELAAATDDDENRQQLHEEIVLINVEIAESIVMRYRNRGVPADDLVQVACLGLVKAAGDLTPRRATTSSGTPSRPSLAR